HPPWRAGGAVEEWRVTRAPGLELEEPAGPARGCVRSVERKERARCAARGNEEFAPGEAEALCIRGRALLGEVIGVAVRSRQRHRDEFAVRGRVELDRQARAFRVDGGFHAAQYRLVIRSKSSCVHVEWSTRG